MAHNLSIVNGRAELAYAGETPWHQMQGWDDIARRSRACECEHADHFPTGDENEVAAVGHPYLDGREADTWRKTPFGTFPICRDCAAQGHLEVK